MSMINVKEAGSRLKCATSEQQKWTNSMLMIWNINRAETMRQSFQAPIEN